MNNTYSFIGLLLTLIAVGGCRNQVPAETPPASLTFIQQAPRQASPRKPPLLVLLHGYGADERDLLSLVSQLDPRLAIASPRAPIAVGDGGYAWFWGGDNAVDLEDARRSVLLFLDRAVEALSADPRRVYIAGFSQGAMLTLAIVLTEPQKIAGAAVMSGRLSPGLLRGLPAIDFLRGFPLLITHGTEDTVTPIRFGREIRDALAPLSLDLDYAEFVAGHTISDETIHALDEWLKERLP